MPTVLRSRAVTLYFYDFALLGTDYTVLACRTGHEGRGVSSGVTWSKGLSVRDPSAWAAAKSVSSLWTKVI